MDFEFWQERWDNSQIGFHQDEINPSLIEYLPKITRASKEERALVPLCGKSQDMIFLKEAGFHVHGVEMVEVAARDFFQENHLDYLVQEIKPGLKKFKSENIEISCTDFLQIEAGNLSAFSFIFDRAALVALPEKLRRQYAKKISEISKAGVEMLLVTFEYEPDMGGPPFCVPLDEVEKLYSNEWDIELLSKKDILKENPRFVKRGLTSFSEETLLLKRK